VLGGAIGLVGGVAGVFIGFILGYLVEELLGQFRNDRDALDYFENPGRSDFYEGSPGLAAFCALGVLIAAQSADSLPASGEAAAQEAARTAKALFPGRRADLSLIEQFCRLAWTRRDGLNPDLLAESLAARRRRLGDLPLLALELYGLAAGETARDLAASVCFILDPCFKTPEESPPDGEAAESARLAEAWKILGLLPGTPLPELKTQFRTLAIQFHPDSLQGLDEKRREAASRAFIAIKDAYRKIVQNAKRV
jgi:DnaJ like chaperone protein